MVRTGKQRIVDESDESPLQDYSWLQWIKFRFRNVDFEEEEWICKYCQHHVWKKIPIDDDYDFDDGDDD